MKKQQQTTAEAVLAVLAGATSGNIAQSSLLATKANKAPNPRIFSVLQHASLRTSKASGLNKPGLSSIKKRRGVQSRTDHSCLSHRYFNAVIINGEKNVLFSVKL